MSAHEALAAFAADLVEEIASGRALELAAGMTAPAPGEKPGPAPTGPGAVHPQLGQHLSVLQGDTISGLAYAHLNPTGAAPGQLPQMPQPGMPGQPASSAQ